MATKDIETFCDMLDYAEINYERDEETYPDRIVVRVMNYHYQSGKDRVVTMFDFAKTGKLLSIS